MRSSISRGLPTWDAFCASGTSSRGITNFMEHCRGLQHHRVDCLIRLRRGLALHNCDWNLMSPAESAEQASLLEGVTVPVVGKEPDFTTAEVFKLEMERRPVWDDLSCDEMNNHKRTVRLFLCLVVDALYRDCDLTSVRNLCVLMVAADAQHVSMFGPSCPDNDVLVTVFSFLIWLLWTRSALI